MGPRRGTDSSGAGREPPREVDLHGLNPEQAERRLSRELHAARVRGEARLVVITGAGHGNARKEPILRRRIEAWLTGPTARRLGARLGRRIHRGGALEVRLVPPGTGGR